MQASIKRFFRKDSFLMWSVLIGSILWLTNAALISRQRIIPRFASICFMLSVFLLWAELLSGRRKIFSRG